MIFPTIETERLILNQPHENDAEQVAKSLNHKEFSDNTLTIPFPYTMENAKFWISLSQQGFESETNFIFAIRLKDNPRLIGAIGLHLDKNHNKAELGYWLDKEYWNKGYATEAVEAVIRFGFSNLGLRRIFATFFDFNLASGRVLRKAGMIKEGILHSYTKKGNTYQDHIMFAIVHDS